MNKNVVLAVARRDLRSWFGNPTGYVFIILFVALSVLALLWSEGFFRSNLANLDTLNGWFPFLAVAFAAAITMGTWAAERSSGTQELLFTLPARDAELLLGKYVAGAGVYTLSLLFMLTLPIGLSMLGTPDWGQLFANYLGYWLFGCTLIAVTMSGSQLGDNLTVSLILGGLLGALVVFSGDLLALLGFGSAGYVNGPRGQFEEFGRGMIPAGGLLLFVGLTVAFLYLNLALLARRHAVPGQLEGAHRGLRFAALAAGVLALTVIGIQALPRVDSTFERIHSLGAESRRLLAELDASRPVIVTAYVSKEVPRQFVPQKRTLLNLMDQFDRIGGDAIQQRVVFAEPFSPVAREAEQNYNITARTVPTAEGGTYSEAAVFLGFVVQSGTEEVVVPFVEPGMPLEYELTRSIRVAAKAERRTVGVLKTDVELYGGFDFQTFRQKPRWQIVDELLLQYKVENVDADSDYPAVDALVVPQPSSLSQEQMDRLQNWILAGNKALLLEDPAPIDAPGTAATDPKGGQQRNPFGGPPPGQKGEFGGFLQNFGLSLPTDQVVWDLSFRTFAGGNLHPEFLFVGGPGFADDPITSGLDRLVLLFGGHLEQRAREGWTFAPLLQSPAVMRGNGVIGKLDLFVFDPFGMGQQLNPRRMHFPAARDYVLAARVTGPAAGDGGKQPQLIVAADIDIVGNQFFAIRRALDDPGMRFDNVTFVLNCIDSLVGDQSLIELRKRRPKLRTLTAVEAAQTDFETSWLEQKKKAEDAAKEALDGAQKRLDDAVAKVRENQELDEQAKEIQIQSIQDSENRKFEQAKARIEGDKQMSINEARHQRDAQKLRLYNGYRWLMLLLAPLPALAMGLYTFARRRAREVAIVPENRRVK